MPQMHKAIREMLPDFLSGALDAVDRGRLESHLAGCPDCSRELAEWRAMAGVIGLEVQARAEAAPAWRTPDLPLEPPPPSPGDPGLRERLSSATTRSRAAVLLLGILLIFALLGQTGRLGHLGLLGEVDRGAGSGFWLDFGGRGERWSPGRDAASLKGEFGPKHDGGADSDADLGSDAGADSDSDTMPGGQAGATAIPIPRAATPVARVSGSAAAESGGWGLAPGQSTSDPARLAQAGLATATLPPSAGPSPLATFGSAEATASPTPASNPNIPPGDPPGEDPPERPKATADPGGTAVLATATATSAPATQSPSPSATMQPVTGRVSGEVRGPDGLPRAEIAVIADRLDAPAEPVLGVTDIDGAYALELDPGRWILHAETPAYQLMWHGGKANPRSANPVDIEVGTSLTADFYLESNPPARVRGRVTDAEGRPLARALVLAAYPPDQPGESPRLVWSSFSDASGDYQLYLPPGAWFLAAAADWRTESLSWWGGAGSLEEADQLGLDVDSTVKADFTLLP